MNYKCASSGQGHILVNYSDWCSGEPNLSSSVSFGALRLCRRRRCCWSLCAPWPVIDHLRNITGDDNFLLRPPSGCDMQLALHRVSTHAEGFRLLPVE